MKKSIFVVYVILAILLVGCSETGYQMPTKLSDTTDETINSQFGSEDEGTADEGFSFDSSINVFPEGDTSVALGYKMEINKGEITKIKLITSVTPDKSMIAENIPLRIWIIADGVPIDFSVNNGEYKPVHDVTVDANKDITTDVSFVCSKDVRIVTIECVYFPEDIPQLGKQYGAQVSYTLVNTAYSSEEDFQDSNEQYYVDVLGTETNYGIDVGVLAVEENYNKVSEPHQYEDVVLKTEDNELLIKFNSGTAEISYYIFILCDGEMLRVFDNDYTCLVDCASGLKTYQYAIPGEFIPESGLHTFQVIATPAEKGDNLISYSSTKVRVQIQ